MQDAELLVKGYEIKLSQEEAVPADLSALESHRTTLQVGFLGFFFFFLVFRDRVSLYTLAVLELTL